MCCRHRDRDDDDFVGGIEDRRCRRDDVAGIRDRDRDRDCDRDDVAGIRDRDCFSFRIRGFDCICVRRNGSWG